NENTNVKVHKLQVEDEQIINKIPTEILRSNIPDYFDQDQVKCLNREQLIQEHLSMRGHKESSLKLKKPEERNSFPLLENKYIRRYHDVKKQSSTDEEQQENQTTELKARTEWRKCEDNKDIIEDESLTILRGEGEAEKLIKTQSVQLSNSPQIQLFCGEQVIQT